MLSIEAINQLLDEFNKGTLDKSKWTHDSHLIVGIWHLKQYPFYDAICRIKSGIIALNNFHGTQNTGTSGYHETLTVFWATIISRFIAFHPTLPLDELVETFLQSNYSNKNLPFEYYDKELLMSNAYRAIFIEGNKKRIDTISNALTYHMNINN